ncbi:uncharacterized protein [Nicotiana sylvestris]|uniref:uncharacterized protein n=1 Tax=Nicotiana sylvestris TaxID=4096 RepID=UPI00388C70E0
MLTTEYELFRMKDDESIQDMHTRFTSIINELHSLRETIPRNKLVRKILNILPRPWESKVNAITESKDLQELTIEELGDSSGESEDETDIGDSSMMAVEGEENEYDSTFALMVQSDDDEDDHNKEDRDSLTLELGEAEQTRDDLVAVVIHQKETIENFKEERNDLLAVIADLRETIERLGTKSKSGNFGKGKEIASEEHIRLENELKVVRTRICVETEKNKHLQTDLERVKNDLEKFLKWAWSSKAITVMYTNNGGNRQGIGFQKEKTPYNPHSKYATVSDNWLCTHCGNNGHFKENCQARVQSVQKNKVFAEKVTTKEGPGSTHKKRTLPAWTKRGTVKGSGQQLFMDSRRSKHMTGNTMDFLSLKALQGGNVSFGNGIKGYILGVGKVGKSLTHYIENVYYVNGLKNNLLSVSQICDKGNKVEFLSKICTITDPVTGEVVLMTKRYKNIYVADFESLQNGDLSFLKVVGDDVELWHRRLGHASFSLLNKLIQKDLFHGLPMSKFKVQRICDACARGKHVKSSFKSKRDDQLGKFDAKSDEGIFLGYASQSKAYKIYIKRTQCVEKSVHVIFVESYPSCEKSAEDDQEGVPLLVPGEVIDMTNRKTDMMSQVKEMNEDNTASSSMEPGTSFTTTKAEKRVVDAV